MRKATARITITATIIIVGLAACRPVNMPNREDALHAALNRNDLQVAQDQLVAGSRVQWRQDSEALVAAHGAMRIPTASGGQGGFPPGFAKHYAIFRTTFADGYERCLWVEGRGSGALTLVNGGYVDCGTIPAPSVVYVTPLRPGTLPATPTP